jgi:hypothetical protein
MTGQPDQTIGDALVQALELPDLRDALVDVAEVGLDQLLDEGIVRDIPVLGVLARLRTTYGVIRDHLFVKKVARFLRELGAIPQAERMRFLDAIDSQADRRRLGDALVLLLDRLDDMDKPELLARLFGSYVRGRCDLASFRRLSTALDRLPLVTLPALAAFYGQPTDRGVQEGEYLEQFAFAGLVEARYHVIRAGGAGGGYFQNALGRLFLECVGAA